MRCNSQQRLWRLIGSKHRMACLYRVRRTAAVISCSGHAGTRSADVIVVGAGAAGLTAAYFAAQQGARVMVLERTSEAGKKILMSGGSRCNVLPLSVDVANDFFTDSSVAAMRAVFRSWTLDGCKSWLKDKQHIGIALAVEQESRKYFPVSNSSREVRDKLVQACLRRGVSIRYDCSIEAITPPSGSSHDSHSGDDHGGHRGAVVCSTARGEELTATNVIVATGGLSFPAVGTDGTGHRVMAACGHSIHATYPALTPLLGPHPGSEQLAGVSLYSVDMTCKAKGYGKQGRPAPRSGLLFTHKGYSGPSVLDLSHHAVRALDAGTERAVLRVNWTGKTLEEWRNILQQGGKSMVVNVLKQHLPNRLAEALCKEAGVMDRKLAELRKNEKQLLEQLLCSYELPYHGHAGYKKAEVTGGGVALSEIDCSTMRSKVVEGVYVCGEIVDVFGRIGGFNFYWAWVSGRLAGLHAGASAVGGAIAL